MGSVNTTVEHLKKRFIVRAFVKGYEVGDVRFYDYGDGTYRVRMIYVREPFRLQGIGTELMQTGMRAERVKRVILACNFDLWPFYEQLGVIIVLKKRTGYELLYEKTFK
jgi:GNAT superfamily N-acetyltransferase